ncbi:hypothetical protein [Angustibacter sp. Root456]|uniref:hypothetical protein n=1 Tax=Angustibacter sp. Root456 TaxID=1736539 RepID=UPI0006FB9743|nr:hypothetical protein [Angustibacter sp. Root456]KQX66492.1 hypothetical protein ASD06_03670 [Angustibacter sp. Root456]
MERLGTPRTTGTPAEQFHHDLLDALHDAVEARLRTVERRGGDIAQLGDPHELAERMAATLPVAAHPFDVELGPFYDTTGLSRWWGVSRQALADRVRRGTLLACRTFDGHLVYPAFQFARDGAVRPGIAEAVAVFSRAGVDGWTAAIWLTTASAAFDGDSAVDHLVVHRASAAAVRRVLRQAQADVAAWAA